MSAEELEAERLTAREAFDEIDTDGSNSLDSSEIRRLIISLGREEGTLDDAALALAMAEMRSSPLEGAPNSHQPYVCPQAPGVPTCFF
eukprot:COSAG05_NODE_1630_length_4372_cov_1.241282_5_plen_88_part_00